MKKIEIFLSCPLQTLPDKKLYLAFRRALEPYIPSIWTIGVNVPYSSREEITGLEIEYIRRSDALVAIVALRWLVNGYIYSYSSRDEIIYADIWKKPIYLFIERGTLQREALEIKAKHTWEFDRELIFRKNNLPEIMKWIKEDITRRTKEKASENWEDILPLIGVFVGATIGFLAGYGFKELIALQKSSGVSSTPLRSIIK